MRLHKLSKHFRRSLYAFLAVLIFSSVWTPLVPKASAATLESPTNTTMNGLGIPIDPLVVTNCLQLMEMDNSQYLSTASYVLGNDIDCSSVDNFIPIASIDYSYFDGDLDGRGYTISNISISQASGVGLGLFHQLGAGHISNLNISNSSIQPTTASNIGLLAGSATGTSVDRVKVSGVVNEDCGVAGAVGGLVGRVSFYSTKISNSHADVDINFEESSPGAGCGIAPVQAGGLIGYGSGAEGITIDNSSTDVDVNFTGTTPSLNCTVETSICRTFGGLIGYTESDTNIIDSYAAGSIVIDDNSSNRNFRIGGLTGVSDGQQEVTSSFASLSTAVVPCAATCNRIQRIGGISGAENLSKSAVLLDVYFDAQKTNAPNNYCVGNNPSNNGCSAINTVSLPNPNYFNNINNPPLDDWDFDKIWQAADSLPELRQPVQPNPSGATNVASTILSTSQIRLDWSSPSHMDELGIETEPKEVYVAFRKASNSSWEKGVKLSSVIAHQDADGIIEADFSGYAVAAGLTDSTDYVFAVSLQNSSGYWGSPVYINARTATPGLILISDCQGLQDIQNGLDQNYQLSKDIDCSDTINWNGGLGFKPLGAALDDQWFSGIFAGNGYSIDDLYIAQPSDDIFMMGLFATSMDALIQDVSINNMTLNATEQYMAYCSGLVAYAMQTDIINVHVNNIDIDGPCAYAAGVASVLYAVDVELSDSSDDLPMFNKNSATGSIDINNIDEQILTDLPLNFFVGGGLLGQVSGYNINNSYANIQFTSSEYTSIFGAVLAGIDRTGIISKVYGAGELGVLAAGSASGGISGMASVVNDSGETGFTVKDSFNYLDNTSDPDNLTGGVLGVIESGSPDNITISNTYFDADVIGINDCDALQETSGCTPISGQPNYFKNNFTNPPLDTWDFSNIWMTTAEFPVFKAELIKTPTPISQERLNRNNNNGGNGGNGGGRIIVPPANIPSITEKAASATPLTTFNGSGAGTQPIQKKSFFERITDNIANFVRNLPEGVVRGFPYALFSLALGGIALILLETRRQGRRLQALKALIARQRSIAQQRDTFWHLAANYLRAPVTLLMGATEIIQLKKKHSAAQNGIVKLVANLQNNVSEIMGSIENSDTLKGIEWPKDKPIRSVFSTLGFWLPLLLVASLVVLANYIAVNFRHFDVGTITYFTQILMFVLVAYALYVGLGAFRSTKQKVSRADSLASRQAEALNNARTDLVHDSVSVLSADVTSLKSEVSKLPAKDDTKILLNEGADRLQRMVSTFELLSAAETGHLSELSPDGARTDLGSVLDQALSGEQATVKEKDIVIDAPDLPKLGIAGSDRLVGQVIGTVLDNAVSFSPVGSTVNLELLTKPGMQGISIQDQGPGVSREQLSHMFEPFTKADGEDALKMDHEGLGINLYLNKLIMEHLGGNIVADSSLGKGTTVSMWWPVK